MSINTYTTVLAIQVGNKDVAPGADHAGVEADRAEAAEEASVLELHAGVDQHLQDGGVQLCHEV
jgi:hypothetical protein